MGCLSYKEGEVLELTIDRSLSLVQVIRAMMLLAKELDVIVEAEINGIKIRVRHTDFFTKIITKYYQDLDIGSRQIEDN